MGGVEDGYIPYSDVRDDVEATLKCSASLTPRYEENNINSVRREVLR